MSMSGISGDIGGAISDFFSAEGYSAEAQGYDKAAQIENQNVGLEESAVAIQQAQERRQVYMSESSATAAAGANGLAKGGSVGDILRSSTQQGALTQALTGIQGNIQENAYEAQSQAYTSQANMANAMAQGSEAGGIFDSLMGVISIAALL